MKLKVYIETTVVSYLAARLSKNTIIAGRQVLTQEWWESRRNSFDLVVSELVFQEAGQGDPGVAKNRTVYIDDIESLAITDEAVLLAETLVIESAVPKQFGEDALHIAICAINGIDFLLIWNCKHLANAIRRNKIEAIVESKGYQCPIICTPAELMEE